MLPNRRAPAAFQPEALESRRLLSEVGFRSADYSVGSGPVQAGIGDFDRDGAADVAVALNGAGALGIYFNTGNGDLRRPIEVAAGGNNPVSVVGADFDRDGVADLAVGFNSAPAVSVLRGRGDGTFDAPRTYPTNGGGASVTVGDVNADGRPDLVTANWEGRNTSILLQLPDGTFGPPTAIPLAAPPTGAALHDVDADGKVDLVHVLYDVGVTVRWGNGDGTFTAAPRVVMSGRAEGWPGVADANGDGRLDVVVATLASPQAPAGVVVVPNAGGRAFATPLPPAGPNQPNNLVVANFVHDGNPDVITSSSLSSPSEGIGYVLTGRGDGTFDHATVSGAGPSLVNVLGAGDLNGDGLTDVVGLAFQSGLKLRVLVNEALPGFGLTVPGTSHRPTDVAVAEFFDNHRPGSPFESYSATIDWGDGTQSAGRVVSIGGGRFRVFGSHVYERNGSYTLNTTARNGAGGVSVERGGMATVADAPVSVAGHNIFYNRSAFDGFSPAANAADDDAIATDKVALLPGRAPSFANVTSYVRGVNGVMVDIAGLPLGVLNGADFLVRSGTSPDRSLWRVGPAPSTVTIRRDAGVNSSDRITLTWPDFRSTAPAAARAVANGWVEVTVRPNARTGLRVADVFAFGNLIGETGDAPAAAVQRVTASDFVRTRAAMRPPATAASQYDFNRDGRVNAGDVAIVRSHLMRRLSLPDVAPVQAAPVAREPFRPSAITSLLRE